MKNRKTRILGLMLSMLTVSISTSLIADILVADKPNPFATGLARERGLSLSITEEPTTFNWVAACASAGLAGLCYYAYKSSKTKQPKEKVKKPEARFFVPASWNHQKDLHITVKKGDRFRIFVEKNSEITKNEKVDLHGDSPLSPVADKLHNPSYDIHRFDAKKSGEGVVIFMRTKPSHHRGSVEQAVMVHIEE